MSNLPFAVNFFLVCGGVAALLFAIAVVREAWR